MKQVCNPSNLYFLVTLMCSIDLTAQSIPRSQLGAEADQQAAVRGVTVTAEGLKLSAPMQKLEAYVAPAGAIIRSVSETEGRGDFSITPVAYGRTTRHARIPANGAVSSRDARAVTLDRGSVAERFSAGAAGIRQDFVIARKPTGNGALGLSLSVKGVIAASAHGGISLTLPSGRTFVYGQLRATDAHGRELAARMAATGTSAMIITVEDAGAPYPVTIDPTIADADWMAMNHPSFPGTNYQVNAIAYGNGRIYVGGNFDKIGDISAGEIAQWDGARWDDMDSARFGEVSAITSDNRGNVYAGLFRSVYKWDGQKWTALGAGLNCKTWVGALACDSNGILYAAGDFDTAGTCRASGIARWNGIAWDSLAGAGARSPFYGEIHALAADGRGRLYVGTEFSLVQWDGKVWRSLTPGMNCHITAILCDSAGPTYAGGLFKIANGFGQYCVAKWNGAGWDSIGLTEGLMINSVNGLALDRHGRLYATTSLDLMMWDGKDWTAPDYGGGINGPILTMACDSNDHIWVGGAFAKERNERIHTGRAGRRG
jgi:hypothetical protein